MREGNIVNHLLINGLLTSLILLMVGLDKVVLGQDQAWTYDFGSGTGTHSSGVSTSFLPSPQTDGGTARVRVGSQGGQFELINPGIAGLGEDTELQITAPTGGSTNKFSIYDYVGSELFYTKYSIQFETADSGEWYFFQGDGNTFNDNNFFNSADVFTGIFWEMNSSSTAMNAFYRNGTDWDAFSNASFVTGIKYDIEIFANNSATSENYDKNGVNYALASDSWDLWIDGSRIESGLPTGNLGSSSNIDSFLFTSRDSNSNEAILALDDITYANYYPTYVTSITMGPCWRMLSSPVDGATYADLLAPIWTQGFPGADYSSGTSNVLIWPDVSGFSDGSWVSPNNLNDVISPGTGFIVSVFGDDDFDGTDDGFPKTLSLAGVEHTGTIEPDLNSDDSGWTLVGNPFGDPIDFDDLTKSDLTNVAYIYDRNAGGTTNSNAGGWRSTNGTFGGITDGIIAPFQGFFVENDGSNPSLAIPESAKTTGGTFFGKELDTNHFVEFEVEGEGLINSAWIHFSENGSFNRLRGDAYQLYPFSNEFALLGSIKDDGDLFDIAEFPLHNNVEIPIYFESTATGYYSISIKDLNLKITDDIVFIDTQTGEQLSLTDDFKYEFFHSSTNNATKKEHGLSCNVKSLNALHEFTPQKAKAIGGARFVLKSDLSEQNRNDIPRTFSLNQNYPNPFNPTTVISYDLPENSQVNLAVYDMMGRRVATLVNENVTAGTHQVQFDASSLSSGTYMYRLQAGGSIQTKKLTLIK
jgi:hypothetical protein